MSYKVAFYSPDSHLVYNLHSLDEQGVGGGVTARIRMAHALAELGHNVTMYNNCPKEQNINNVHYVPSEQADEIDSDILIVSTSGDGLDLSKLSEIDLHVKLRILLVHGVDPPNGIDLEFFDYIYAVSNFLRDRIETSWAIETHKLFTALHGIKNDYYLLPESKFSKRDPFGIVYTSHPSKGLESAINILTILRRADPRFSLHIYGGYSLWGEQEQAIDAIPNLTYHGLIGQKALAYEMQQNCYALNIQDREEPFGMSLIEALKAGCIVLASAVGAFPEIIQNGHNGFLVEGKSGDESTHDAAARIILDLVKNEVAKKVIQRNAIATPHTWQTIAETWHGHWDWVMGTDHKSIEIPDLGDCQYCGSTLLHLADGLHCTGCGRYHLRSKP